MSLVHLEPSLRQSSTFADRLERDEEPFRRVQNVRSARRNQLRRRIKFLCALMLLTYCARFVLTVTIWDVSDSSFTVPFSLGVAYCGLVGASRENRDTLSCFYVCCVASICLYGANVMVQTKMIFDVKRGETIQGNSYTPEQVIPVIITAIGLETFLAIVQVVGAMSGRELVRKHLVVNMQGSRPHLFANNAYSLEFIQRQQTAMETANDHAASLTEGLNIKMTIASIPLRKYVKGSQPEDFPIAGNAPPVVRGATPLNVCVDDSGDPCAPASAGSNDEDNLCVICQDNVEDGATVKMLPCKHYFHVHCIDAWLERSLHCPISGIAPSAVLAQISSIPDNIGDLSMLSNLRLEINNFTSYPEAVNTISNLQQLSLASNSLTAIPDTIEFMSHLDTLSFPDSIVGLETLRNLDLQSNALSELPESFGSLVRMTQLDLSNNPISALPCSMSELPYLALSDMYV
ncbi:E3 ubiquitin-protein ligase RLIM [Hondaea fermentalgiana]|uniref:E3 ubiquitin-protein ligase RLIM n=1 Tax=Hondaea fermentalgiana TaxID=2315210 RepID=A0A2R5GY11_9STRA|nr:E3 ubiquitin-protein ligase RLIM [Hondaea fermentalgiana]|eukprot:GBG34688.1 E3 ubiquitin-protein ligase RLIM [Hondaea fermentalgiana]